MSSRLNKTADTASIKATATRQKARNRKNSERGKAATMRLVGIHSYLPGRLANAEPEYGNARLRFLITPYRDPLSWPFVGSAKKIEEA